MAKVIISLHDVAPATAFDSAAMLTMVEHHGLRATLLVIPGPYRRMRLLDEPAFAGWLREAQQRGHEIALHGWSHCAVAGRDGRPGLRRAVGRVVARGCAEFLELGDAEARWRIVAGLDALDSCDFRPTGFTPPGWLASHQTFDVLRQLDFAYTTSQWTVFDLRRDRSIRVGALSQRPGSPLGDVAATANLRIGRAAIATGRALRIAIHPADLHHPRLRRANEQLLARAADHCESVTYADFVGQAATVGRAR